MQLLADHLEQVGRLAARNASKLKVPQSESGARSRRSLAECGEVLGLLHDLGKYSNEFQNYLASAVGLLDQDADDYVDATRLRGKIDHSTAGAQLVWRRLSERGRIGAIVGQLLALCIASHHSGLIDCLAPSGDDGFAARMRKPCDSTHLDEAVVHSAPELLARVEHLLADPDLIANLHAVLSNVVSKSPEDLIRAQHLGLLARFLFSCLVDADRTDTADFERPHTARVRRRSTGTDWAALVARLEDHLARFVPEQPIDQLRFEISRRCQQRASGPAATCYSLTVPTGGGKTLASLRFALNHAKEHQLDRVVYVVPFTTIIDQNADVVRGILEPETVRDSEDCIVLEHHSNVTPEHQGWREKILSENWDAPVIFTTTVQFLDTLFGAGTRGARRMHQLANAVIVFDEIQSLPIKCVHLFNNAVTFLTNNCNTTAVLCTATQPLLDSVEASKGALPVALENELMPDVKRLFAELRRVEAVYDRRPGGWTNQELAGLARNEAIRARSCLVVVNTKASALALYDLCVADPNLTVLHLSTSLCPAHRKQIFRVIWQRLEREEPVLCISTQLIEAGVDLDFGSVIRFMAGLDSIAQAAGRCNRHGRRETGIVHIVNPRDENLADLNDIRIGRKCAERVLHDYEADPARFAFDRVGPAMMKWYYENYFFARAEEMTYPVPSAEFGRADSLLHLLSTNPNAAREFHGRRRGEKVDYLLRQSFMTAAKAFRAIDAPTRGVIVPYGEDGRELVSDLCSSSEPEKEYRLLKRAQQFTVNVFPNVYSKLEAAGALLPIHEGTRIFHVDPRYYSSEVGLSTEVVAPMEALIA